MRGRCIQKRRPKLSAASLASPAKAVPATGSQGTSEPEWNNIRDACMSIPITYGDVF